VIFHRPRYGRRLVAADFGGVLDTVPPGAPQARFSAPERETAPAPNVAAAQPIRQQPEIDATVIELDGRGHPVRSGTVLMSPKYKDGIVVPVDANFHTSAVRYRLWDNAEWYANNGQGHR
jgi:hypothetical protein